MVIGYREMAESSLGGLSDQGKRFKASVAAEGVAVKVEPIRTAIWTDRFEHRAQGMAFNRHGWPQLGWPQLWRPQLRRH